MPVISAQSPSKPETAQPSAAQFAKQIDGHYNALRSLRVEFTQSYDGMGMHRVERGTLLLAKAGRLHTGFETGKMRWTYAEPAGKLFVLDGKDAYFYTPGQNEVQRVPARQLDDLRSPLALLLGHAELAKQLSELALQPAADGRATVSGVPRGLEGRVSRLSVTAAPDGTIYELVVEETDGVRNSFHFSGEVENAPAPGSAFAFAPPAGTHVVNGMPPM